MKRVIPTTLPMPDSPAPASTREIALATGLLEVTVTRASMPLDALCGFAARRNAGRGFLFVSRVLGRHIPVRPSVMLDAQTRLAGILPDALPGPVLFIGMAETATGLGHGVFEAWMRITGRDDALYIHSTRYAHEGARAFTFDEVHSHAPDHIIYAPRDDHLAAMTGAARTLVMVDDECTTGRTFDRLARAARAVLPALSNAYGLVLTNWSDGDAGTGNTASGDVAVRALLSGRWHFTPGAGMAAGTPDQNGGKSDMTGRISARHGRFGITGIMDTPQPLPGAGGRTVVLGSGEFVHAPFRLALALEEAGVDVHFQATTRSPVMVGGAIRAARGLTDNYGEGLENFVYNLKPGMYDTIIWAGETAPGSAPPELMALPGAQAVYL